MQTTNGNEYVLTAAERETIIRYDQQDRTAVCFTYDPVLIRKLDKMIDQQNRRKQPLPENACISLKRTGDGWREYTFPSKYLKVVIPRELSEEKKAELAERMNRIRAERTEQEVGDED